LKPLHHLLRAEQFPVAPLAGAWIETCNPRMAFAPSPVAPLAGAWIETPVHLKSDLPQNVAPLAGAWIETLGI